MGVFAQHAPIYAEAGLPCFPVDTRAKRPCVKNWQRAGRAATAAWSNRFGDADGLGVCMGARTGLVEVDVDLAGDAALAIAVERFGETPVSIRTASGKSKLWFRHNGEGRHIRVAGDLPIDVLGDGYTIAPPSRRSDLGTSYSFLTGSLTDIDRLPCLRPNAMFGATTRCSSEVVQNGARNTSLFHWCMTEARSCDDPEALIDAAQTWCAAMPDPLGLKEVERTARSAWRYEEAGRNFVGFKRPQITRGDRLMDDLLDTPDSLVLFQLFERYHSNRGAFAISPTAMSKAKIPPWHRSRIERARDTLIERGYLSIEMPPNSRKRLAGRYRLTMPDSGNNHLYTLSPFPMVMGVIQ